MQKVNFNLKSYGVTRIGERGQVVIPKEVRDVMKLKNGDQFFVFVHDDHMIQFIKADQFDHVVDQMITRLNNFKKRK